MAFSRNFSDFLFVIFVSYSKAGLSKPIEAGNLKPSSAVIELISNQQKQPHLQLEAKGAPLGQILDEVAQKTGAFIHYSKLSDALVTVACKGDNVRQIMDCLVDKQFSMVAKPSENNKPAEFWLVGTCEADCQAKANNQVHLPEHTLEDQAKDDPFLQEQSDALLKQAQSKDPAERGLALYNLGLAGLKEDPKVDNVLREAISDKDPNIRAQAADAIARRGSEEAGIYLRQALQDKNENVRFAAISNVYDNVNLLEQASNDSSKMISDIAKSRLNDLAAQQNK
ncbi:MAG: HEAT repeat domain-containing protein [Methylococcales bacterium]